MGPQNEIHTIEAKVWVRQPNHPPIPAADMTAQEGYHHIISRQEKWKCAINILLFSRKDSSWRLTVMWIVIYSYLNS